MLAALCGIRSVFRSHSYIREIRSGSIGTGRVIEQIKHYQESRLKVKLEEEMSQEKLQPATKELLKNQLELQDISQSQSALQHIIGHHKENKHVQMLLFE